MGRKNLCALDLASQIHKGCCPLRYGPGTCMKLISLSSYQLFNNKRHVHCSGTKCRRFFLSMHNLTFMGFYHCNQPYLNRLIKNFCRTHVSFHIMQQQGYLYLVHFSIYHTIFLGTIRRKWFILVDHPIYRYYFTKDLTSLKITNSP